MAQNMDEVLEKMKEIYREFEQLAINSYNIGRKDEREEKEKSELEPKIEFGAIIRDDFYDGVITKVDNMYNEASVLWGEGETTNECFEWVKARLTGKKIKGLNGVFNEIKGVSD